jgi:pimeloyl-ACP methyl ester carboxylesterase
MPTIRRLVRGAGKLAALCLPLAHATPALAAESAAIFWQPCDPQRVGDIPEHLTSRLECGTFRAPLDHIQPDGRSIAVGVVRARAMRPDLREGAIFVNVGGPGSNPARLVRSIAATWSREDPLDPDTADKVRLAERFDLVGVIPRGLEGGHVYRCLTGLPPRFAFLPSHLDDANWNLVLDEATAQAQTCAAPPEARYINTEQHVHDMDAVRRSLGDDKLHVYGISYGGRVGAWYAATYPTHIGRMLLDSSMRFTHGFLEAGELMRAAQRKDFQRVLAPIVADPVHYGLPADPAAIATSLQELPARAREAWHPYLDTPPRVAAALWLADWMRASDPGSRTQLEGRIRRQVFSSDASLNGTIRWAALQLAGRYFAPARTGPEFGAGQDGDSVRRAVGCNDDAWSTNDVAIREHAVRNAARDLHSDGEEILEELVCARWRHPRARVPNLDTVGDAPRFLLLQAEHDLVTPIEGARALLASYANATLLVARRSTVHGLFNFTTSSCIERTVSRYLLDGTLPDSASRELHCDGATESPVSALPHTTTTTAPTTPVAAPHDEI